MLVVTVVNVVAYNIMLHDVFIENKLFIFFIQIIQGTPKTRSVTAYYYVVDVVLGVT